jgi:site-specific DNA recombinase
VPEHAELIRELFRRYLAIGNVRLLVQQLEAEGIPVPQRTSLTGRQMGGGAFTRGQIYKILSNPIYLGEIHHKGRVYDGKHEAIIDRELWDQVQAKLADNTQGQQRGATAKSPSLLAGRVFDETGEPLVAAHTTKKQGSIPLLREPSASARSRRQRIRQQRTAPSRACTRAGESSG